MIPNRLSRDKSYVRPTKTFQETLSNTDIKERLKEYKKVDNIKTVSIGTHCRYFSVDLNTKQKVFRLGGNLNKIDPEGRYVILSNGSANWSVQIPNTIFFQKMTEAEYKEEMKKDLKKEIMTEMNQSENEDDVDLKKQVKILLKKLEETTKKNEQLTSQLKSIEHENKKEKKEKKEKK